MADNSINCVNGGAQFINFGSFTPLIGQFYSADNLDRKGPFCLEITGVNNNTSQTSGTLTAQTLYDSCLDCFIDNCGYVVMEVCSNPLINFNVFISGLTFIPEINDVYYCSILGSYSENQSPELYEGCFTVTQRVLSNSAECNKLINSGNYAIVNPGTTFTAQTDCQTCIANNPRVYEVFLCNSSPIVNYYINLPLGLQSHIISFESNGEQFCGFVKAPAEFVETTGTFISDFGKLSDEISCNTCLDVVSQKILLRDCLDSENEIVVWGSSLYGIGGASNLSTNDGCFEVVGETTSAVTYSGYLDYDPQPDCNSCLSCSGLRYEFEYCGPTPTPPINYFYSNQILSIGDIFYHPYLGGCVEIITVSRAEITDSSAPYYSSVEVFGNGEIGCETCEQSNPFDSQSWWQFKICQTNLVNQYTNLYINTAYELSPGDIVKLKIGENDFLCVELLSAIEPAPDTSLYTSYDSIYTTCEDCINTVQIGTTLLNCNTGEPNYVSLNQTDWLTATGTYLPFPNFSQYIPYSTVKLSDGKCYNLENPCVLPLTATTGLETVSEFNLFCSLCSEGFPPRSANTETIICEQVCISGGSGGYTVVQVVPPHPVWTDGYGTPVTQLNAVTLGGMFGLNS